MEKIKANNQLFDLVPMGINIGEKSMSITLSSSLTSAGIETAFTEVSSIEHQSEGGELLATYLDGVAVKSISRDIESGTYTIVISTDAVAKALKTQAEATEMLFSAIDYILTQGLIQEGEKVK